MKLLYVLPLLVALPMGAFAAPNYSGSKHFTTSDTSIIRPFIGYNIGLGNLNNIKIKDSAGELGTQNNFNFNDNNAGNFVFGVEFSDIAAVSLNPSFNTYKVTARGEDSQTTKTNEIDLNLDLYITNADDFKPFVSLMIGYVSINEAALKTSGAVFGLGLGCRNYVTQNMYVATNVQYVMSNSMSVKEINRTPVDGVSMRMSGLELNIGVGYRF